MTRHLIDVFQAAALLELAPFEVIELVEYGRLPPHTRAPLTFHRPSLEEWRRKLSDGGAGSAGYLRDMLALARGPVEERGAPA